ncbi:DUF4367 domain-containing protein [Halobacterium litoreum]|uniref:DUF4367 domain-containing protein n=1 Tax=Halobacterium litoreum TaxID=2039234 RepID=A0ABD5NB49_9EURY|nr:DUF4367 domain-containing protein [Halobacterium litoreum]UHH14697.1 DUF4367 domain-containing protein [Halobacterium litoreum]
MSRRPLLAVAVAALLVTSGCNAIGTLGGGSGADVPNEDVEAEFAELETMEATQVSVSTFGNTTNRTRSHLYAAFGDPVRQRQRVLSPESRAGNLVIANETTTVIYDDAANNATLIPRTATSSVDRSAYYASIVAAARENGTVDPETGVSPLPVLPARQGSSVPTEDIGGYRVEYLGTDTIADRTAHGFRMTPTTDAALTSNRTVWLDAEFYYPLKTHVRATLNDRTIEVESRVENVTFNADLPGGIFDFEPPENASVETLNVSAETYDTPEALREAVDIAVPDPDVPEGYAFVRGQHYPGNASQVGLHYEGEDGATLRVSKMAYVTNGTGLSSGENVTVAGREGNYLTTGRTKLLTWSCEESQYSIAASDLSKEELLAVAESVACE